MPSRPARVDVACPLILQVDCLVERLGPSKTDVAVELNGGAVFGGHLEISAAQTRLGEAAKCAVHEGSAQPEPPVRVDHPDVLNRPNRIVIHDALNGTHITLGTGDQPGVAPEQKTRLASDFTHQTTAPEAIAKDCGNTIGVDFAEEASNLLLPRRVLFQERLVPRHPHEAAGQH